MKSLIDNFDLGFKKLPAWFKQDIPDVIKTQNIKKILEDSNLNTVCQSALCPNLGKCWGQGVATFMILGDVCTRRCKFCAVKKGDTLPVDENEPVNIALAVRKLKLKYVVITSVTRDDLPDKGCEQFVKTILQIKKVNPDIKIEVLIPDFDNEIGLLKKIIKARPEVYGHNIEMIKRLFVDIRPNADFERSLSVLRNFKRFISEGYIKSGFMVGIGETYDEVISLMKELFLSGCDILTIGQYLAPSSNDKHVKESRFVSPEEFDKYKEIGLDMGFKHISSGPLIRSSFLAEDVFNLINSS